MSWHKSSYEGRTTWERSDGLRVYFIDQIEAIDKIEQSVMPERERYEIEHEEQDDDELNNSQTIIIFAMMLTAIIALIITSIN
jgi:hypothetical protein